MVELERVVATQPEGCGDRAGDEAWWAGRTALVTGVTGFIGAELAGALLSRGAIVHGLDRSWDRSDRLRRERIERLEAHASFRRIAMDLRDAALQSVLRGVEGAVVFHLAARPGVRDPSPEEVFADNVAGTDGLFSALRAARPRHVLFASSSSVYGRGARVPFAEAASSGDLPSRYARSKLLGELACARYHQRTRAPVTVRGSSTSTASGGGRTWLRASSSTASCAVRRSSWRRAAPSSVT